MPGYCILEKVDVYCWQNNFLIKQHLVNGPLISAGFLFDVDIQAVLMIAAGVFSLPIFDSAEGLARRLCLRFVARLFNSAIQ